MLNHMKEDGRNSVTKSIKEIELSLSLSNLTMISLASNRLIYTP